MNTIALAHHTGVRLAEVGFLLIIATHWGTSPSCVPI